MGKWRSRKEVPLDVIERWLKDADWRVRQAAMNACQGREVPLDVIERGLKDADCDVRQAAMNACQGREVPLDVIERWLKDAYWRVRQAAYQIAKEQGIDVCFRTFDPPALVYKKCESGVIVVAKIPENAEIRGNPEGKCRTNRAEIVDVIGDFCGEPVGISMYDGTTWYYAGDFVEVENFDYSNEECSTGFHFFCTRKQAEEYGN